MLQIINLEFQIRLIDLKQLESKTLLKSVVENVAIV